MFFQRTEAHDVFDAGTIVPAPVEDNDFSGGGKMRHVTLEEHLGLFPVGRCGEGDSPKHPWANFFGDCLDRASFAGGIASFEQDDDAHSLGRNPLLKVTKLDLKLAQLFFVRLAFHFFVVFCHHLWSG